MRLPLLLLCGVLARGADTDGLDAVAQGFFARARAAEQAGDFTAAEVAFRLVLERDARHTPSRVGVGTSLLAQGRLEQGEEVLEQALPDTEAFAALVALSIERERLEQALSLIDRWQDRDPGDPRPWREEARVRLMRGEPVLAWSRYRIHLDSAEPEEALVLAIADALWEKGDRARAEEVLAAVRWPDAVPKSVAERAAHWGRIARARERMAAGAEPLDTAAAEQLADIAAALDATAGAPATLETRLRELSRSHPRSPQVWHQLARVLSRRGDADGAGEALATAVQLSPEDPAIQEAWGHHLERALGGRLSGEAADAFSAALRRDPFRVELHAARARAAARAHRWSEAHGAALAYLEAAPLGEEAEGMRTLAKAMLRRVPEPASLSGGGQACPVGVGEETCERFYLAQVLQDDGELEQALQLSRQVREEVAGWQQAAHLEAQILWQLDRTEEAVSRWQADLALRPEDTLLLNLLARAHQRLADPAAARDYWERSAGLGSSLARLELAEQAWEQGSWWRARRHLAAYEAGGDGDDPAARTLRQRLDGLALGGLAALGGLVALPVLWRRRRRAGANLDELVRRAPGVAPEIARICAAIRHEVLKHRTTLLPALAGQIETSHQEHLAWAAEALTGEDGATRRFFAYRDELEELALRHGVRLNLAVRDETLGPVVEAMERLDGLSEALRSGRAEPERLRSLAQRLNVEGYQALGRLIRRLTVVEVGPAFVREVYARVCAEPALQGMEAPELELDMPEAVPLRIYPSELRDVLANLLRNAVTALPIGGRLGVAVRAESDFITGLEEVLFRVRDTASGRLTTAMVRGRYLERGLGLAVDLVVRRGGSVTVEPEPGWAKAVVVRLPRAERPEVESSVEEAA